MYISDLLDYYFFEFKRQQATLLFDPHHVWDDVQHNMMLNTPPKYRLQCISNIEWKIFSKNFLKSFINNKLNEYSKGASGKEKAKAQAQAKAQAELYHCWDFLFEF